MFTHYMDWWPNSTYGVLSWLRLLPAFFAPAVPVMFYVDWYTLPLHFILLPAHQTCRKNRPFAEEAVENVLRRLDMVDIQVYYARSPASGLWILEFADKIIGIIAVDASLDATNDENILNESQKESLRGALKRKGTSRVATIRHFFAEEAYRRVKIEDDLLQFAIESSFKADETVSSIRFLASPLRPAILDSLKRNKFSKGDRVQTVGILDWEVCWYTLKRTQWNEQSGKS